MIGVFDSGVGGLCAFKILRDLLPHENLVFLRDRKRCPYGGKSRDSIIEIAEENILRLTEMGCERVLIACCTASTVYDSLPSEARRAAIPIVAPSARLAARLSENKVIGVIATDATIRSHAFRDHLPECKVVECAAGPLVSIIESGEKDGHASEETRRYLAELLAPIIEAEADTLILGCTHFHALRAEIEAVLSGLTKRKIKTVSSAEVGARLTRDIVTKVGESEIAADT